MHPFFNDDRVAEAARVVEIAAQGRNERAATTAILVRNRSHLIDIIPRLREAGLRFRAIEIEGLGHRPVVQDLLALTRALAHLADSSAWLALLRAPWCGLLLADIYALASPNTVLSSDRSDVLQEEGARVPEGNPSAGAGTVWEWLSDETRLDSISADGRRRLLRVRDVLQACLNNRGRQSLRSTVEAAWLALGGPATIEDPTDFEDAAVYLDYLEKQEDAGDIPSVAALEEGLGHLFALPDVKADDRLQVMTIHKAKGLEFDWVIVPGLGRSPRSNDKKLFMWMETVRSASGVRGLGGGNDLLLAPIQETGADEDSIYLWLEKLEGEKERLEDGRLLYVAATRGEAASASAWQHQRRAGKRRRTRAEAATQPVVAEQDLASGSAGVCASRGTGDILGFRVSARWQRRKQEITSISHCVASSPVGCYRLRRHPCGGWPGRTRLPHRAALNIPGRAKLRVLSAMSCTAGCNASQPKVLKNGM